MWYNNDGSLAFPEALVGTGYASGPGLVTDGLVIAEEVYGASLAWSELTFTEPVAASQGALYLVFTFPPGAEYTAPGEGGGPAIGYYEEQIGSRGWITGNGEQWDRLHDSYRFAVIPQFVPYEEGMAVKCLDGDKEDLPVVRTYLTMYPNPFNPQTTFKFGLRHKAQVEIEIYDLRGMRVLRLVDGVLPAGHHAVVWAGRDGNGRQVASGAYFARMRAGTETLTQRMMLLR